MFKSISDAGKLFGAVKSAVTILSTSLDGGKSTYVLWKMLDSFKFSIGNNWTGLIICFESWFWKVYSCCWLFFFCHVKLPLLFSSMPKICSWAFRLEILDWVNATFWVANNSAYEKVLFLLGFRSKFLDFLDSDLSKSNAFRSKMVFR